ncbi:type I polyketide synthase [Ralstonia syzygii]|uniref:Putative polyketide synthase n=1 Tax=Ralstonia syzygii R24 TaxID=907261 RepID=G3AAR3_9RALS|nr:beta-ketoacyl synthase N-terminal-like domain-containing protein [Ralstonia syzygii]CCA87468.1 putative polyketide synthase [Ralstonia syzygii R24]
MEKIAIIGMSCRLPGAASLDAFWHLLEQGEHGIGLIPKARWDADALFDTNGKLPGKSNSRFGGFIDDVERFDAQFFGISPREAVQMDPQQRILLELFHEAMEDAGLTAGQLGGSDSSVYVGVMSNDYLRHQTEDDYRRIDTHTGGGVGFAMVANRISYQFDLRGPSMAIDTACSSSLTAAFHACQSIWTGQSRIAFAAGVNLMLDPTFDIFYAKAGLLAPDGKCKTLSAQADGIGRGEGAGVVVLKSLGDALADGDRIHAVIRGGAVNHDGRSNGIAAPNRWAQEALLRSATRHAGVSPRDLQYVELHGTGTLIGDPIEANALGTVMNEAGRDAPCWVGSVKSNIGHLEGAAGVAALIKTALSLRHGVIPPSLWCDAPNPHVDFERLPLRVSTRRAAWPDNGKPRMAGVSSFGLGGANAHLVLEQSPLPVMQPGADADRTHWLLISARSEAALRALATRYADLLRSGHGRLEAICSAALRRRAVFDHRLSVRGRNRQELIAQLEAYSAGDARAYLRYRKPVRKLLLGLPAAAALDTAKLGDWLRQSVVGSACWNTCHALLAAEGPPVLPEAGAIASTTTASLTAADIAYWHFAAQYSAAAHLIRSGFPIMAIVADGGVGQLAALCATGALPLEQAFEALKTGQPRLPAIKGDGSATRAEIPCHAAHGPRIQPESVLRNAESHAFAQTLADMAKDGSDIVLLNLHGDDALPFGSAAPDRCHRLIDASDNPYATLFSQLAPAYSPDWRLLAPRHTDAVELPRYPWQRESFWLERRVPPGRAQDGERDAPRPDTAAAEPASPAGQRDDRHTFASLTAAERRPWLIDFLASRTARVLHMAIGSLDVQVPLNMMGIDSLTAVEIKNLVERELGVPLPVVKFLDGYSVSDFAAYLEPRLLDDGPEPATPTPTAAPQPAAVPAATQPLRVDQLDPGQLDNLTDEQVDALLNALLATGA